MKYHKLSLAYLLSLFCILLNSSAHAQWLRNTKVLYSPISYVYPDGPFGNIADQGSLRSNKAWIVFSDRGQNPTYNDAGCVSKKGMVDFLTPLYVIEETSFSVKVIPYNPANINSRTLAVRKSVNTGAIGWIKKENLLLWRESLIHHETRFKVKAFGVYKPEALRNPEEYLSKNKIYLYDHPSLEEKHKNTNELRMFQFLFVLKRNPLNESLLLAKKEQIGAGSPKTHVLGWVSEHIVQEWDQRLCLEPNSDPEAASERISKNVKTSIFLTEQESKEYAQQPSSNSTPLWNKDTYSNSMSPQQKRLPILDQSSGTIRTGFVTDIINENGITLSSAAAKAIFDEKYNETRKEVSRINVVFVVDGNPENRSYAQPILQSINSSYKKFNENTSENSYHYGAVVYRSDEYKDCGMEGDLSLKVQPLSGNHVSLSGFLQKEITRELPCTVSPSGFTNMNQAIKRALRLYQNPKNTNILIVVGAAGSRYNETTVKEIVNSCVDKNVAVIGFQVNNSGSPGHESFVSDMFEVIESVGEKVANSINSDNQLSNFGQTIVPKFKPINPNFYTMMSSPIPGSILFPNLGQQLERNVLNQELELAINKMEKNNNDLLSRGDSKFAGMGEQDVKFDPQLLLFMKKMGLSHKEMKVLSDLSQANGKSFQFFIEGYTPMTVNGVSSKLYQEVILIDYNEYTRLENTLEKLARAQSATSEDQVREKLQETYREILAAHYGRKHVKDMIKSKGLDEINELVTGVDFKGDNILKRITIDDITNRSRMTSQQLYSYCTYVEEKLNQVRLVASNPKYGFTSFNAKFYWMPAAFLP